MRQPLTDEELDRLSAKLEKNMEQAAELGSYLVSYISKHKNGDVGWGNLILCGEDEFPSLLKLRAVFSNNHEVGEDIMIMAISKIPDRMDHESFSFKVSESDKFIK